MNGRSIDQFFTLLVGTVVVVVAIALGAAFGSAVAVIAGLVALSAAYPVNMMGAAGMIRSPEEAARSLSPNANRPRQIATALVFICWIASLVSIIAAGISTL